MRFRFGIQGAVREPTVELTWSETNVVNVGSVVELLVVEAAVVTIEGCCIGNFWSDTTVEPFKW